MKLDPCRPMLLTCRLLLPLAMVACGPSEANRAAAADPRLVLAAHLTHGLGDDILDTPLLKDSINAELLVQARFGADSIGLTRAFQARDSAGPRITALIQANLLRRESALLRAVVPIVIGRDQTWYDSLANAWAQQSLREIEPALDSMLQQLGRRGWQEWAYHFTWSQVFDSQRVWALIQRATVTPPLSPAITWVVFPDHAQKTGTNLFPGRVDTPWFLSVTWTPRHRAQLGSLEVAADTFIAAVSQRAVSDSARRNLIELGLLTSDGKPAIPVLRAEDSLLHILRDLAARWAAAVGRSMDAPMIAARLRIEPRMAWAMAYHNVSWSALTNLIEAGRLSPFPSSTVLPPAQGTAALVPADPMFLSVLF